MKKTFSKQVTLIFALGLAGASMFSACERDEPVINPNPITPTDSVKPTDTIQYRDIELFYSDYDDSYKQFLTYKGGYYYYSPELMHYDSMPDVRYIYMVVGDDSFGNYNDMTIKSMVQQYLKPVMFFSDKMRGKGTFYFPPEAIRLVPEDSLWITKQGWTIKSIYDYER